MFSQRTDWKLAPNRLSQALAEVRASGVDVLDLTVSNPTRADLHFEKETILASLAVPQALDYDPQPKGLLQARQSVADYYGADHGEEVDPESIILTTSTSEAYSYAFRLLCDPGTEILVPKPSYPLFEFLADLQDVKLTPYPLLYDHGWQIDFPSLDRTVNHRTKAVIVVHPNNPTGSYASSLEMDSLNSFCKENKLALVVDEVFLDYSHDGATRRSFVQNGDVLTFTLSGLSKVSALPQMKVAWIVTSGPQAIAQDALSRLEVIADTFLSMNAPLQFATPTLLAQRKQIQPLLLDRVRTNLQELQRQLSLQKTCGALDVEGGWYAILRVPVTRSDEDLAIELLREKSVFVHPGHFYDFPTDGYLVLSLITPNEAFSQGLQRVLALLNS